MRACRRRRRARRPRPRPAPRARPDGTTPTRSAPRERSSRARGAGVAPRRRRRRQRRRAGAASTEGPPRDERAGGWRRGRAQARARRAQGAPALARAAARRGGEAGRRRQGRRRRQDGERGALDRRRAHGGRGAPGRRREGGERRRRHARRQPAALPLRPRRLLLRHARRQERAAPAPHPAPRRPRLLRRRHSASPTRSSSAARGPSSKARSSASSTIACSPTSGRACRSCSTPTSSCTRGVAAAARRPLRVPIGLEWLQSDSRSRSSSARSPSDLVPQRDLGVMLFGDFGGGTFCYQPRLLQRRARQRQRPRLRPAVDQGLRGRLFFRPLRPAHRDAAAHLGLGVAGSYGSVATAAASSLPTYKSVGAAADLQLHPRHRRHHHRARRRRRAPRRRPLARLAAALLVPRSRRPPRRVRAVVAERAAHGRRRRHPGARVEPDRVASCSRLERASYDGVSRAAPSTSVTRTSAPSSSPFATRSCASTTPPSPTSPTRRLGAQARELAGGLNWYLTEHVRFMLSYHRTDFVGGAPRREIASPRTRSWVACSSASKKHARNRAAHRRPELPPCRPNVSGARTPRASSAPAALTMSHTARPKSAPAPLTSGMATMN